MLLNFHKGDKILFIDNGRSIESHFHQWARKRLKPNTILTLLNYPSNNGFCIAADSQENIFHINVITDRIQIIKQGNVKQSNTMINRTTKSVIERKKPCPTTFTANT